MRPEDILLLARQTLGHSAPQPKDASLVTATQGELVDFAHQLFDAQVAQACERVGVHQASSSTLAQIDSALRGGVDDLTLGRAVRQLMAGRGSDPEASSGQA